MIARLFLAVVLWCIALGAAAAGEIELKAPDGRTVILYDDFTWEYKRAAPTLARDTVTADTLVGDPSKYLDKPVVVSGSLVKLMGDYKLQSDTGQKAMTVELNKIRRADQIKLDKALDQAGMIGSVKVQIRGQVEHGFVVYKLVASELILLGK